MADINRVVFTGRIGTDAELKTTLSGVSIMDGDIVIGIDNNTGDAWTEEFNKLEECLAWLKGGELHEQ